MSEVKLNLVDSQRILHGTIHGSVVDACVAALTAEPETIAELENSLARYIKPLREDSRHFGWFSASSQIDTEPWDAGIVIIDLAGRLVAAESTYSQPGHEGTIYYHDGTQRTDVPILYRVSDEWRFLNSVAEYEGFRAAQLQQSRLILDPREILYGRPLLMHILTEIRHSEICAEGHKILKQLEQAETADGARNLIQDEEAIKPLMGEVSAIHARWLTTPLAELDGKSPRELLLAKRELVDFDLHTREMQWTFLGEGPPCLPRESFAYRFGGFGSHECIIYYDLVRVLLWRTVEQGIVGNMNRPFDFEAGVKQLEKMKSDWLENPQPGLEGSIPALIIENERKRLPNTVSAADMIIDDNCEMCRMTARAMEMGEGPGFWHLDSSNMDEFAFSFHQTREEWEKEIQEREEFNKEFNRKWEEREERRARGEPVDDDEFFNWFDAGDDEAGDDEAILPSTSPQRPDQIH